MVKNFIEKKIKRRMIETVKERSHDSVKVRVSEVRKLRLRLRRLKS